jgi:hypothetical protein
MFFARHCQDIELPGKMEMQPAKVANGCKNGQESS